MANKKKIEELELARRKKQTERTIQIAAVVIGALLIIGLIWLAFANRSSNQSAIPTIDVSQITPQEQPTQSSEQPTPGPTTAAKQYSAYPPMTIDVNKKYFATFKMAKGGEFKVQLFPDKAPKTVNSFVFLAKQGFYDGVTFHRVLEGFMAQGGDPTGTGMGGPGYEFENEKNDLQFDKPGVVAMANAGRNTNGSQFFIMFNAYGLSESDYTIFGQVVEGMDVVNGITRRNPDENPTFPGDAIQTIEITEE